MYFLRGAVWPIYRFSFLVAKAKSLSYCKSPLYVWTVMLTTLAVQPQRAGNGADINMQGLALAAAVRAHCIVVYASDFPEIVSVNDGGQLQRQRKTMQPVLIHVI